MNIVNLTPHALNIHDTNGQLLVTVEPSVAVARVTTARALSQTIDGIPCFHTKYGEVTGLPPFQDGTIFVVSGLVRAAVPHRHDVWQPGELLRNEAGQVIGCVGLSQ